MTLALLLPQFAPNLYDLAVMLQADRIILQDNEKWSRKSRVHRAKIRTVKGTQWINLAVRTEDRKKTIRKVRIDQERDWLTPLLRTLRVNYRNSIYFDFYEPDIVALFKSAAEYTYLLPFVLNFQRKLFEIMGLSVDYELASNVAGYDSNPDKLAKALGADVLFQEYDSRHYQRQAQNRTKLDFIHPKYYQHFEGFESDCCLLDLLFQKGPESFKITDRLKK